jgi:hypothetical protein
MQASAGKRRAFSSSLILPDAIIVVVRAAMNRTVGFTLSDVFETGNFQ